jgi:hypothetical protein
VGLFFIALITVGCSFAFAAFVFVKTTGEPRTPTTATPESSDETMARVINEIERLAALRERGALTTKEFNEQKARALSVQGVEE